MITLQTQINENPDIHTKTTHLLPFSGLCPISGNPQEGSTIEISYTAKDLVIEVYSLRAYLDSYIGGRGAVRSMEGMVQNTARDCALAIRTAVRIVAHVILEDRQTMTIECEESAS